MKFIILFRQYERKVYQTLSYSLLETQSVHYSNAL